MMEFSGHKIENPYYNDKKKTESRFVISMLENPNEPIFMRFGGIKIIMEFSNFLNLKKYLMNLCLLE